MGWKKTGRRWRVFWHVTLRDGTIDIHISSPFYDHLFPYIGFYTVFLRGCGFPIELLCLKAENKNGTPEPCHLLRAEYYSTNRQSYSVLY